MTMALRTELCRRLCIDHPVVQAGMAGGPTTPELVAAVSNAGGLGTIGAGYLTPDALRKTIHEVKARTRRPFAVNVFVGESPEWSEEVVARAQARLAPYRRELGLPETVHLDPEWYSSEAAERALDACMQVVIEEDVPVVSFTFGCLPMRWVEALHRRGAVVIGTATTVAEAVELERHGVDAVVVQGFEAGGHRGTFKGAAEASLVGTLALVPQVVDHVGIPVIAAGGIMDGRGLAAALCLGAQAAQLGTAFLTTVESGAHHLHQEAVRAAVETDTVLTRSFSGKLARGIRNGWTEQLAPWEKEWPAYPIQNTLTRDIRAAAAAQNRGEYMSFWAGQAARLARSLSAGELVTTLVEEARRVLMRFTDSG